MQRMDPTISKLPRNTRHRRVIAPPHPWVIGIFRIAVMAMAEIGDDQPNVAQFARAHHGTRLTDHRIGGIAIIHRANSAIGAGDFYDFFAFFDCHRHGLFAKNIETCLKKGFGDFKMRGIWRGHSHKINAILAGAFPCQHLAPIAIGAISGNSQTLCIGATHIRAVIQSACHKVKMPIRLCA